MKNAGKARSYGLYRHLRTSKEIIENLLNYSKNYKTDTHFNDYITNYSLCEAKVDDLSANP